ncbi:MAG: ABC transporter ATP-binding protein [Dongiaceae bacterium]
MLKVSALRAAYGRIPILHGIELAVAEGEFVGILGHNGMGKTTLLKTLAGLLPATAGRIELGGADVTRMPAHRRSLAGIGYVAQGRDIFPKLTALENLRLGAVRHVAGGAEEARRIDEVVSEFPRLKPLLQRPGGVLSGGEQQILALARCLCGNPKLVLLDEPTEGIQPSIIDEIVERLQALGRNRRLTVVLVEQNLDFIAALSQRVLVIQRGRITGELTPAQLGDPDVVQEFAGMRG